MTLPVPHYYLGLAAQPLDDLTTVTWTDVTAYVLAHPQTKMGANHELARTDAGTSQYLLDNRDRRFDPTNTAGPYYPLRLGIPIRETQTWAGTTYIVSTMYIDDYDLQWPGVADAETMISCVDAFKFLNLFALESSQWKILVRKTVSANIAAGHNTAWMRLDNAAASNVASDYSGQGWDGTYQGNPSLGLKSIIAGDTDTAMDATTGQRASVPYKHLLTGFPFTVEMVIRVFSNPSEAKFLVGAYDVPANFKQLFQLFIIANNDPTNVGKLIATVANPYPLGTESLTTFRVDDGRVHHIAMVMSSPTSLRLWVDGNDVTAVNASNTFVFPDDLATGYAIGNTPAVGFGDFGLDAGSTIGPDGTVTRGGIQSVVFYDGLALSGTSILDHAVAAIFGWGVETSGSRFGRVCAAVGLASANYASEAGSTNVQATMPSATSLLAYLQLLAETEGGRLFVNPSGVLTFYGRNHSITNPTSNTSQATFTDDGTGIAYLLPMDPHLDDLDWWNRASVAKLNGAPQIWDSIPANNSPRVLTKSGLLMDSDIDTRALAQYLVGTYQTPVPRIRSISFEPADSPTLGWPAALGLGLGDRITVKRHPIGGGPAWVQDHYIEGITHQWASGVAKWRTTYALSQVESSSYFMVGSSVLGGTDVLYY